MQRKVLGLSLALLLGLTSSALADVVVTIGNHNLLPNAAGQTIQFKFIKIASGGGVTWENGSNHTYTVPSSGTGYVNVNWQY